MKIIVYRRPPNGGAMTGDVYVDGAYQCVSLEDIPRPVKIKGETAIPAGTYKIMVTWSPRFERRLPLLLDVPGFEGVRIHPGNTAADTEGCILVGTSVAGNAVVNSRAAFNALFTKMEQAIDNEDGIAITLVNAQLA